MSNNQKPKKIDLATAAWFRANNMVVPSGMIEGPDNYMPPDNEPVAVWCDDGINADYDTDAPKPAGR
ncbi:MAG: hypothetical protein WC989_02660 [Micavibrio sp.]